MQKHKIQYHATGRVEYNNSGKGVSSYFYLDVLGSNLQDARKNGLQTAQILAPKYLLEDSRKEFKNPNLQIDDIKMTIYEVK